MSGTTRACPLSSVWWKQLWMWCALFGVNMQVLLVSARQVICFFNNYRWFSKWTVPPSAPVELLRPGILGTAVQHISMRTSKVLCFADVPAFGESNQDHRDYYGAHVSDCNRQQGVFCHLSSTKECESLPMSPCELIHIP